MLKNGNKTDCGFADEIVAYLYEEANAADRKRFETHLARCSTCTDELASISAARHSVFEWRRHEFEHLATPEIFVPSRTMAESSAPGVLDALKGFFAGARWPVTVVAAATIILGVGFILMSSLDQPEQPIAENATKPVITEPINSPKLELPQPVVKEMAELGNEPIGTQDRTVKPVPRKSVRPVRSVPSREKTPQLAVRREPATSPANAPVLTNFEESEDRSLRLADLVGEGGASQ